MKKLLAGLLGYLVATALIVYAAVGSVMWLTKADAAPNAPLRVAPIPPRIAESIARRAEPLPPEVASVDMARVPSKPMQEQNAALSQPVAPRWVIRELSLPSQPAKMRKARVKDQPKVGTPAETTASSRLVTTARSDNPY
jgi:hypothetical protein